MGHKTWMITGVSSGFGNEITQIALAKGDTVIGTVRNTYKIQDLINSYPDTFEYQVVDVTNTSALQNAVKATFEKYGGIDVIVSNAGYGLYGAAEEFTSEEEDLVIATNLKGSITFIKSALPYFRKQKKGRIIQIASVAGQVGAICNSMYNATKFGITGYCEAVALEMAKYNVGVTIVEPGGARTEFRYGSVKVAQNIIPELDHVHKFLERLDPKNGLAPGDPHKMAQRIIESVEIVPAPLHLSLGSAAVRDTISALSERIEAYKKQIDIADSTDYCE